MAEEAPRAPSRGLKAKRAAAPAPTAKSWTRSRFMKRPARTLAGATFGALLCGVAVNAIMLQKGHHPAPLFGPRDVAARRHAPSPYPPAPREQSPTAAPAAVQEPRAPEARPGIVSPQPQAKAPHTAAHEDTLGAFIAKREDTLGAFIAKEATGTQNAGRVYSVQKALRKLGFPVKLSGKLDATTKSALVRFERSRSLPVSEELTPRILRTLAARSGLHVP